MILCNVRLNMYKCKCMVIIHILLLNIHLCYGEIHVRLNMGHINLCSIYIATGAVVLNFKKLVFKEA